MDSIFDALSMFSERKRKLGALKDMRKPSARFSATKSGKVAFSTCPTCGHEMLNTMLKQSAYVCVGCGHHYRISAATRLRMVFDKNSKEELFPDICVDNPLQFPGYEEKLAEVAEKTGIKDACVAAVGTIDGHRALCAVLDSSFLMGSMGVAVGEKITLCAEYAMSNNLPLIIFSASGGARMQEGIFSLMQMAKTSAAIKRLSDDGGLYISVMTHPTTGGVTASFASLGDITLAEPKALIGFAGPRVIEQTIRAKLPEGFQRAEFQQEHGFVDAVVNRKDMKNTLAHLLALHKY